MYKRLLLLALITTAPLAMADGTNIGFLVIVNTKNTTNSMDKKQLADIFLKKVTRWDNDEIVKPVDLAPTSPLRKKFSESVLKRTVSEIKNYWIQRIFSGNDLPPTELESDAKVVEFIINNPTAVGYVSSDTDITGVKIIGIK